MNIVGCSVPGLWVRRITADLAISTIVVRLKAQVSNTIPSTHCDVGEAGKADAPVSSEEKATIPLRRLRGECGKAAGTNSSWKTRPFSVAVPQFHIQKAVISVRPSGSRVSVILCTSIQ